MNTMKINLNEWEQFSSRRNSNGYISKDGKWYLKASPDGRDFSMEELKQAQNTTNLCIEMGIKTPKVGDIVEMPNGKLALMYEYIKNKYSYTRFIEKNPESMEEMMKKFAREAKLFHSVEADISKVEAIDDKLERVLLHTDLFTDEEKALILKKVRSFPKKTTVLHGDFQPSNILISGDESYFIDLGMLTYGNPLFDIGFLWFVTYKSIDRVYQAVFHTGQDNVIKMWEVFAKEYFESDDLESINEMVRPYGLASLSIVLDVMPNTGMITYNKEEILDVCRN